MSLSSNSKESLPSDMSSHLLTQEEREDIFVKFILPYVSKGVTPKENPLGIILGGQPGAGKSNFIRHIKEEYSDIAIINGDDLRGFHPQFAKLLKEDEENAANLTQEDCNYWVEKLIDFFSQQKTDMIIEGTMRRSEIVLDTIKLLAKRNYNVETRTITVPFEISRASMAYRYEIQKNIFGLSRYVKPEGHETAFASIQNTLRAIFNSPDIWRMQLYSRRESEYVNKYDNIQTDNIWKEPENPADVFHELVTEKLIPSELRYTLNLYTEAIRLARIRNADKSYLESLIEFSRPVREKLEASLELQKKGAR